MNVKLLPIQGILALLRRVLPGRIGRCSPEQAELLRAAEHRQNDLGGNAFTAGTLIMSGDRLPERASRVRFVFCYLCFLAH